MAIFLDTGFFLGIYHPTDSHHNESCSILKKLGTGQFGLIYSSLYIVSEVATLLFIRTNFNLHIINDFYSDLYGDTKFVAILPWSLGLEQKIWDLFKKVSKSVQNKKDFLSFTDISSIIYCREYQIDKIASFDSHFDRFLFRVFA